jgi:hypothetical protein
MRLKMKTVGWQAGFAGWPKPGDHRAVWSGNGFRCKGRIVGWLLMHDALAIARSVRNTISTLPACPRPVLHRQRPRGLSAMDLGLTMVARMLRPALAREIAEFSMFSRIRDAGERERSAVKWRYGTHDERVSSVELMEESIASPIKLSAFADSVGPLCDSLSDCLRRSWKCSTSGLPRHPDKRGLRSALPVS